MSYIAQNYYKRVILGLIINVNEIGKPWRHDVISCLERNNYIVNDDGTVTDMNP